MSVPAHGAHSKCGNQMLFGFNEPQLERALCVLVKIFTSEKNESAGDAQLAKRKVMSFAGLYLGVAFSDVGSLAATA